jgi:hypothetical protein
MIGNLIINGIKMEDLINSVKISYNDSLITLEDKGNNIYSIEFENPDKYIVYIDDHEILRQNNILFNSIKSSVLISNRERSMNAGDPLIEIRMHTDVTTVFGDSYVHVTEDNLKIKGYPNGLYELKNPMFGDITFEHVQNFFVLIKFNLFNRHNTYIKFEDYDDWPMSCNGEYYINIGDSFKIVYSGDTFCESFVKKGPKIILHNDLLKFIRILPKNND